MQNKDISQLAYIKPCFSTYFVAFMCTGFFSLPFFIGSILKNDTSALPMAMIPALAFLYLFIWLQALTIRLFDERVEVKSLFSHQIVPYSDIIRLAIEIGLNPKRKGKGFIRMELFGQDEEPILIINIKLFSRKDMELLANILAKNTRAECDDSIKQMINKDWVPSLNKKGQN